MPLVFFASLVAFDKLGFSEETTAQLVFNPPPELGSFVIRGGELVATTEVKLDISGGALTSFQDEESEAASVEFTSTAPSGGFAPDCVFTQLNVSEWAATCPVEKTFFFCIEAKWRSVEGVAKETSGGRTWIRTAVQEP